MRSFRANQLLRRGYGDFALDQMRRLWDVVIASVLLAISAPLMLLVALAIRAEGSGPILVKENCIGLGGRRFRMLRFRTVPHDPDCTRPSWARKSTRLGVIVYNRDNCRLGIPLLLLRYIVARPDFPLHTWR